MKWLISEVWRNTLFSLWNSTSSGGMCHRKVTSSGGVCHLVNVLCTSLEEGQVLMSVSLMVLIVLTPDSYIYK